MEYESDTQNIKSLCPEDIADIIFSDLPKKENTYNLNLSNNCNENDPSTFIFEIIISILLEGMCILNEDIETYDLKKLKIDDIMSISPYIRSLGFDIKVTDYDNKNEYFKTYIDDFYCKIILKCDKQYSTYFIMKDINKEYTFFFNPKYGKNYPEGRQLKDIYAILVIDDMTYKISFDFINMATIKT